MDYVQITADQRKEMLGAIGVEEADDLFAVIPEAARFSGLLDLPAAASELELQRELSGLASRNRPAGTLACFLGGGAYDHFIPAFIDQLILRGEFLTAYTPYQAEASQGSLQAFFEFQSQIARLTGLDIANASLYEGATATAEGALLALNHTGKRRIVVASTLHPDHRQVLETYLHDLPAEFVEAPAGPDGRVSVETLWSVIDNDTAGVIVQSPNVFGVIEDWSELFSSAKSSVTSGKPPVAIAVCNPISLGLLKTPGECGADIATGEGQPLGTPLQFGGPYLGLFAARQEFLRRLPGRLVGRTTDASGRPAYCLTLQTREQHIRGAKATSNICTNQGLFALRATMYMTALGPHGLRDVASQCYHKAHYLAGRIADLDGYSLRYPDAMFFNEFVVRCPRPAREIVDRGKEHGVLAGIPLSEDRLSGIGDEHDLLVAVTEKRTKADMETLVNALASPA